ncbi:hypothetical protein BH24ACT1_BH24ACT1_04200 [soil metagenome]
MPSAHRHFDDETLNAILDGEATEEERAAASGCTDCSARLVRLGHVAAALGTPVSPSDPQRRRAAVDAALEAQDPGVTAPTPLNARRGWRMAPGWAAAAAVVLAGALAVPLVNNLGGNDQSQETATAGDTTAADRSVAEDEAALSEENTASGASGARPDLGEIDLSGLDELAVSITRNPQAQSATRPAEEKQPCERASRQRNPSLRRLAYAAEGTIAGRPAVVLAFEVAPAGAPSAVRLLVLVRDDCRELASASADYRR